MSTLLLILVSTSLILAITNTGLISAINYASAAVNALVYLSVTLKS